MTKTVWISFDLGIKGDYQGLYRWLDVHDAKECGDSLAMFKFDSTSKAASNIPSEIKAGLETSMALDPNTRIYVIYRNDDGTMKGRFIFGQRKASPWEGFAPMGVTEDDE